MSLVLKCYTIDPSLTAGYAGFGPGVSLQQYPPWERGGDLYVALSTGQVTFYKSSDGGLTWTMDYQWPAGLQRSSGFSEDSSGLLHGIAVETTPTFLYKIVTYDLVTHALTATTIRGPGANSPSGIFPSVAENITGLTGTTLYCWGNTSGATPAKNAFLQPVAGAFNEALVWTTHLAHEQGQPMFVTPDGDVSTMYGTEATTGSGVYQMLRKTLSGSEGFFGPTWGGGQYWDYSAGCPNGSDLIVPCTVLIGGSGPQNLWVHIIRSGGGVDQVQVDAAAPFNLSRPLAVMDGSTCRLFWADGESTLWEYDSEDGGATWSEKKPIFNFSTDHSQPPERASIDQPYHSRCFSARKLDNGQIGFLLMVEPDDGSYPTFICFATFVEALSPIEPIPLPPAHGPFLVPTSGRAVPIGRPSVIGSDAYVVVYNDTSTGDTDMGQALHVMRGADKGEGTWTDIQSFPTNACWGFYDTVADSLEHNGKLYIFYFNSGGYVYPGTAPLFYHWITPTLHLVEYDPGSDAWTEIATHVMTPISSSAPGATNPGWQGPLRLIACGDTLVAFYTGSLSVSYGTVLMSVISDFGPGSSPRGEFGEFIDVTPDLRSYPEANWSLVEALVGPEGGIHLVSCAQSSGSGEDDFFLDTRVGISGGSPPVTFSSERFGGVNNGQLQHYILTQGSVAGGWLVIPIYQWGPDPDAFAYTLLLSAAPASPYSWSIIEDSSSLALGLSNVRTSSFAWENVAFHLYAPYRPPPPPEGTEIRTIYQVQYTGSGASADALACLETSAEFKYGFDVLKIGLVISGSSGTVGVVASHYNDSFFPVVSFWRFDLGGARARNRYWVE